MEDLKKFACRVKSLRTMKGMTKEELCQDETELTVRQLTRIESGNSKPTLTKINFLADRLGVKIYELMPDYEDLPKEYLDLKYHILRDATYSDIGKMREKRKKFSHIYNEYYANLPEEEQLIVDSMRQIFDLDSNGRMSDHIFQDYVYQLEKKESYTVNDLLLIRLLMMTFIMGNKKSSIYQTRLVYKLVDNLLETDNQLGIYQLFVLRDTLFVAVGLCYFLEQFHSVRKLLDKAKAIMQDTQDYQKESIFYMLEWKYQLRVEKDMHKAYKFYKKAILFAMLVEEEELLANLKQEWLGDTK